MVRLYEPRLQDLWFRQEMLADPETMSYNHAWGGIISFPEERWNGWFSRWVARPEGQRFYRYVTDEAGVFVGEIAFHNDETTGRYLANILIAARYRRRGYGGQALDLLCSAAAEAGVSALYDDIAVDNPAVGMFLRHGFSEEGRTESVIILKKELEDHDRTRGRNRQ